jgi:hypothetical protein
MGYLLIGSGLSVVIIHNAVRYGGKKTLWAGRLRIGSAFRAWMKAGLRNHSLTAHLDPLQIPNPAT